MIVSAGVSFALAIRIRVSLVCGTAIGINFVFGIGVGRPTEVRWEIVLTGTQAGKLFDPGSQRPRQG